MNTQTGTQNRQTSQMQSHTSASMLACIQACLSCFQSCEQTIVHCLSMGGKHTEADHMKLMNACVEICQTSAKFMMLESPFHRQTCGVCADVCRACAESCDKLDGAEMKACAETCRKCAQSCEDMAKMQ